MHDNQNSSNCFKILTIDFIDVDYLQHFHK